MVMILLELADDGDGDGDGKPRNATNTFWLWCCNQYAMNVTISWSRAEPYPNISVAIKSIKALNLVTSTGVLDLATSNVCWLGCYN